MSLWLSAIPQSLPFARVDAERWRRVALDQGCSPPEASEWAVIAAESLNYPADQPEFVDQVRQHLGHRQACQQVIQRVVGRTTVGGSPRDNPIVTAEEMPALVTMARTRSLARSSPRRPGLGAIGHGGFAHGR